MLKNIPNFFMIFDDKRNLTYFLNISLLKNEINVLNLKLVIILFIL